MLGRELALRRGIEMGESSEAATVTYPAIPPAPVDGNVGGANVVAELVLAGRSERRNDPDLRFRNGSESGRPPARAYETSSGTASSGFASDGLASHQSRSALVGLRDFLTSSPTFSKELAVTMMPRRDHDVRWEARAEPAGDVTGPPRTRCPFFTP